MYKGLTSFSMASHCFDIDDSTILNSVCIFFFEIDFDKDLIRGGRGPAVDQYRLIRKCLNAS